MAKSADGSVTDDGISDFFRHDETDLHTVKVGRIIHRRYRNMHMLRSATHSPKCTIEFFGVPQAHLGRQQGSGRELCAALTATSCENSTSGACAHTLAEAVHLSATAIIRLESPLNHGSTPTLLMRETLAFTECSDTIVPIHMTS